MSVKTNNDKDSRIALFVWSAVVSTETLKKEMSPFPCPGNQYQETIKQELILRGHFLPL